MTVIGRHAFAYLIARGLPALVGFVTLMWFSHQVSASEYGRYAIVISVVSLLNSTFFQWLRLGLLRFLPQQAIDRRRIFLNTLSVGYLSVVLILLIVYLMWAFFCQQSNLQLITLLGMLILFLQASYDVTLDMMRTVFSPLKYGMLFLTKSLLFLLIAGIFNSFNYGATGLLIATILSLLVPQLAMYRKYVKGFRSGIDMSYLWMLLRYGLPLTLSFVMSYIINSSDRIFLRVFGNPAQVGEYSVAYDFSQQTIILFMSVVNLAAYPLAIRALEDGGVARARIQLRDNVALLLLFAMPVMLITIALAPEISNFVFGAEYRDVAASIIPWVAVGAFLSGIKSYYLDLAFQLSNCTMIQVWPVIIGAAVNAGMNIALIPTLGLLGAAYSTVTAYVATCIVSILLSIKVFPLMFPSAEVVKICLSGAGMTIILLMARMQEDAVKFIGVTVLALFVYSCFVLFLNVANMRTTCKGVLVSVYKKQWKSI